MEFVQVGDIIYLEKGMTVQYPKLPIWFFKNHHPYSEETRDCHTNIGEVRTRQSTVKPLREEAEKMIKFVFEYLKVPADQSVLGKYVAHVIKEPKAWQFVVPAGEYLVTDIKFRDYQRKVFCQTFDPEMKAEVLKIYFYQNSNYLANNNEVKVVKRIL
jgi:hypothetical protein